MSTALPTGVVTFVFTDIEGSTRLLQALGERFVSVLDDHSRLLRAAWERWGGWVRGTEGDSFMVAFPNAHDAVEAVVEAQRAIHAHPWPPGAPVRVRMGLHTGTPTIANADYVGIDVHRAARIAACGHGGQVLLSRDSHEIVTAALPLGVTTRDLGEHRLKDLERPEWIFELVIDGLPSEHPPLRSLEVPSTIPTPATGMVGREADVARIRALLRQTDVRIVTLTGAGGVGKTRLSIAVAEGESDRFMNGRFFVPLDGLAAGTSVLPALARCIGIEPSETPAKVLPQIVAELRAKSVLLVLDNFEQVADQGSVVAELLAQAPRVQALVTSRVALHIRGEHVHPVEPLTNDTASALFFERAQAVVADIDRSDPNRIAVERICQRLDGLPLAIEIAAARTRTLSPPLLLERLGTALRLESKARDLPARQQTLRATIGWSVELMPESARAVFDAMGLFPGGATLEALQAVVARDPLDDVELLLEHSLVRASGAGRFDTLMTIRAFALERIDGAPEGSALRDRHARFLSELAMTANRSLRGPEGGEWRKRLVAETANFQLALAWTLDDSAPPDRAATGAVIAGSLGWFWYTRSDGVEGIPWLERARRHTEDTRDLVRARVLQGLGILYDQVGRPADAIPCLEEGRALYEALGDGPASTRCTNSLGSALRGSGDSVRARAMFELAIARAKALGDEPKLAVAPLFNIGALALDSCDGPTALTALSSALELDRAMSNEWGIAVDTAAIGQAHLCAGDVAAAEASFVAALPKLMALDEMDRVAETLAYHAAVLGKNGDAVGAVRLVAAAWALWRSKGLLPSGPDLRRLEDQLRFLETALPPDERARAETEGAAMTAEQAVAYALHSSS